MALDHAPMVVPASACDPLPSSCFPQRSRYQYYKRGHSPDAPVPQTIRAKRCKPMSPLDVGLPLSPPSEVKTLGGTHSQGPNTQKWFEELNKDVPMAVDPDLIESKSPCAPLLASRANVVIGEPPFYLAHRDPAGADKTSFTQSDRSPHGRYSDADESRPPGMLGHGTCDCSDEYRSVIDDLTVENKHLKQKLQRFQQLHCSHLQKEKLFEVRIHGIPGHKRRDLEQALREIAARLDESIAIEGLSHSNRSSFQQNHQDYKRPIPYATPADSAYASTAASGQTFSVRPKIDSLPRRTGTPLTRTRQQHVNSYSSDIPPCLMPSQSSDMSRNDKKRMVVRRLEQLFTGKSAASLQPDFPRQQQELSNTAAFSDRCAAEATGLNFFPEGVREAKIFANDVQCHQGEGARQQSGTQYECNRTSTSATRSRACSSPHQRPTRPMDLDMHQAQDGADNMNYIRHLGIHPPMQESELSCAGDGWVYLNLLMSLAQIHTLNVTPDFVRKAVKEMSPQFDLSPDGKQVRWRGNAAESSLGWGPEDLRSSTTDIGRSANTSISPGKQMEFSTAFTRDRVAIAQNWSVSDHQFKPLFHHGGWLDDHTLFDDHDAETSSEFSENDVPLSGSPYNTRPPLQRKQESGPIIFYSNAAFCTDLSGSANQGLDNGINYLTCTDRPIGRSNDAIWSENSFEKRGVLSRFAQTPTDSGTDTSVENDLDFPNIDTLSLDPCLNSNRPVVFEASGLSGIQPGDNFMVDVQVEHAPHEVTERGSGVERAKSKHSAATTISTPAQPHSRGRIISANTTKLDPSSLPPPSYICLPFSSSDSGSSDSEDDDSNDDDASKSVRRDSWEPGHGALHLDNTSLPMKQPRGAYRGTRVYDSTLKTSNISNDSSYYMLSHARSSNPIITSARGKYYDEKLGPGIRGQTKIAGKGTLSADGMSIDGNWSPSDTEGNN